MSQVRLSEKEFAGALLSAKTSQDVETILSMANGLYGATTLRPVGDRPNNIGTIRLGSDPALGLVERVTNAMDAMLDLKRMQNPGTSPASPREAARMWYGIPPTGIAEMTDSERRNLGQAIQVSLEESGIDRRPTVVIDDRGTGVSAVDFPKTLLSLNEQNKVDQSWTMGTYGQGGAVTFGFSEATIIMSRRHPDFLDGERDEVAWTIVRRQEDYKTEKMPSYKYLVGADNEVMSLDPKWFPDLDYGTIIVHIAYDVQGWHGPFTTGIWQFFHAALFDPVLPFLITGHRKKDRNYGSRIVIGNAARLEGIEKAKGDIEIAHYDDTVYELGKRYGKLTFKYWVLQRPIGSTTTTPPAEGYVQASNAVSMTLFGQRQDAEERRWIKDNAMLPFLYKNMIVQVETDALTPVAKGELFTSTRERGTKSDIRTDIYDRLAVVLRADGELKRLNQEERERLLKRSTSASSEKVRKRLAKFIKTHLKDLLKPGMKSGTLTGNGGTKTKKGGRSTSPPRDISDGHLPYDPTRLEFLAKNKNIRINQGSGSYSWVEIDAKNGYLPANDGDLSIGWEGADPGDSVRLTMRSKLLGGKSRWFFEAAPDAPVGNYRLRATLLTPTGAVGDVLSIEVRVPPPAPPDNKGTEPETGPRVEWVRKDGWDEFGFTSRTVGRVDEDTEETVIWVNRHFYLLEKGLSGRNLTADAIETRASRYQFPVACALWLQNDAVKKAQQKPDDAYLIEENVRMAEAVLIAADPDVDIALAEGED